MEFHITTVSILNKYVNLTYFFHCFQSYFRFHFHETRSSIEGITIKQDITMPQEIFKVLVVKLPHSFRASKIDVFPFSFLHVLNIRNSPAVIDASAEIFFQKIRMKTFSFVCMCSLQLGMNKNWKKATKFTLIYIYIYKKILEDVHKYL